MTVLPALLTNVITNKTVKVQSPEDQAKEYEAEIKSELISIYTRGVEVTSSPTAHKSDKDKATKLTSMYEQNLNSDLMGDKWTLNTNTGKPSVKGHAVSFVNFAEYNGFITTEEKDVLRGKIDKAVEFHNQAAEAKDNSEVSEAKVETKKPEEPPVVKEEFVAKKETGNPERKPSGSVEVRTLDVQKAYSAIKSENTAAFQAIKPTLLAKNRMQQLVKAIVRAGDAKSLKFVLEQMKSKTLNQLAYNFAQQINSSSMKNAAMNAARSLNNI